MEMLMENMILFFEINIMNINVHAYRQMPERKNIKLFRKLL